MPLQLKKIPDSTLKKVENILSELENKNIIPLYLPKSLQSSKEKIKVTLAAGHFIHILKPKNFSIKNFGKAEGIRFILLISTKVVGTIDFLVGGKGSIKFSHITSGSNMTTLINTIGKVEDKFEKSFEPYRLEAVKLPVLDESFLRAYSSKRSYFFKVTKSHPEEIVFNEKQFRNYLHNRLLEKKESYKTMKNASE